MAGNLYFFTIPVYAPAPAEQELNRFLSTQRVVTVEKVFLANGERSAWSVCVTTTSGSEPLPPELKFQGARGGKTEKVDYREVLSADDFAVFAKLRELRSTLAQQEAVPPYAVFTNEQLAAIARARPQTMGDLQALDGIGESRTQKYGPDVLSLLSNNGSSHETHGNQTV